jgi:hypothetical protein
MVFYVARGGIRSRNLTVWAFKTDTGTVEEMLIREKIFGPEEVHAQIYNASHLILVVVCKVEEILLVKIGLKSCRSEVYQSPNTTVKFWGKLALVSCDCQTMFIQPRIDPTDQPHVVAYNVHKMFGDGLITSA